ncbi:hypothetical protein CJ030_MR5G016227 [Morella rubra]|uniref:UV radiation resistance-associated gene protein n=1 Tax=Morella rubra TaxID=262757 RepID=A0A6A1VPU7_9ROSI|nr:hypothetical protein CJ030_MR5G016227 [Morella rubra]
MERDRSLSSETSKSDPENPKVFEWEDFEEELARLWSLSAALKEAKEKKQSLEQKLGPLIQPANSGPQHCGQVNAESLNRLNELDEMREKLEAKKKLMENMSMHSSLAKEDANKQEEQLSGEVRSLLVAGTALSVARKRLQVNAESLNRLNELDEMREKLEAKKKLMENMSMHSSLAKEDANKQEEQLSGEVRSLLVAGTALSVARKRLQESNRLLAGDKGYFSLRNLQKRLRLRQQCMISQVSLLYPVKISVGPAQEQELELFPSSSRSGLPLNVLPFKKMSFFSDKKEVQRSATALGYVAHAVSLIASYLKAPLRYPLRLGGSHSYIIDYAPSIEPMSSDSSSETELSTSMKHVEFPLFLEGQDTTRAAYAVFLLNKASNELITSIALVCLRKYNT